MDTTQIFAYTGGALFIYMMCWYVASLIKHDFGIVDTAYGIGYSVAAVTALLLTKTYEFMQLFVIVLVILWGWRLSIHIFIRNSKKGVEDYRYTKMRNDWGESANIQALFKVFILQGVIIYIIDLCVLYTIIFAPTSKFNWITIVGISVWIIGYFFEVVGDHQLKNFKNNPDNKGMIMDKGLWQYTRHPNYFGEATMWWGLYFITLSTNNQKGWWTIVSPLLITYLLLFVSGVPLLEKHYEGNTQFEEYKKRVSIFFPLPPKSI